MKGFECFVNEKREYDISVYSRYFAESVQLYFETDSGKLYDGISFDKFGNQWDSKWKDNYENFRLLVADNRITDLQDEIKETAGIDIDMINLYVLASFVNAIVREKYFILLKPTIADTLEEIGQVSKITFDGKVSTTNTKVIEAAIKAIKEQNDEGEYEVERLAKLEEIADNIILQSQFAFYMASFLKSYFPEAKRRANCCMVSKPEQMLILHLLSYFKLAPEGLTDSRFRQLISFHTKNLPDLFSLCNFPQIGHIQCTFLKYKDWKKRKLDDISPLKIGDTVKF